MLAPEDRVVVTPATRFCDYILTAYPPRVDPVGKLHCVSIFRALLREHGLLGAWPVCQTLRRHLGEDETVWAFKLGPEGASVELYFYNFDAPPGHERSVTELTRVLAGHLQFAACLDESQPYFMCSLEIDSEGLRQGNGGAFRIYVGSGDQDRRECAFSYRVEPGLMHLENHYWFYRAARPDELADAVRRLHRSPRAGKRPSCWRTLMPKGLRDCFTICYAVKPRADGLYYSRITTEQLTSFLREHRPGYLCDLLEAHRDDLSHQRWDLGFDFAALPGASRVDVHKLAIHGVL